MAQQRERLKLWQDKVETEVEVSGSGKPLLYLHGPWGLAPDRPFLERLAESNRIFAPKHPGTSHGDPEAAHRLDGFWDLVIYYNELMDRWQLEAPAVVGHSFGGLMAAEIAATTPNRVSKLVLIDPVGLWRDEEPITNWMVMPDEARINALFVDAKGAAAQRFLALPEDAKERAQAQVDFVWAQACTGKFVWPVPDKGLKRHTHRIVAPTLIVWGKADGIIASSYADDFARAIRGAKVERIDRAGHMAHLEAVDPVARVVTSFIACTTTDRTTMRP